MYSYFTSILKHEFYNGYLFIVFMSNPWGAHLSMHRTKEGEYLFAIPQ